MGEVEFGHQDLAQSLQFQQGRQFVDAQGVDDVRLLGPDEGFQAAQVARHVPGQMRVHVQVNEPDLRVDRKESGPSFLVVGDDHDLVSIPCRQQVGFGDEHPLHARRTVDGIGQVEEFHGSNLRKIHYICNYA